MQRTQIQLTERQYRLLRRRAREEGVSMAEVVRRTLDRYLVEETPSRAALYERAADLVGAFRSGASDLSARHDDHLEDTYEA